MAFYYTQNNIINIIATRIEERTVDLAQGKCASFEEYKKIVGMIDGLTQALDIIKNSTIEE
jgi:hypothetical protein